MFFNLYKEILFWSVRLFFGFIAFLEFEIFGG